MTRRDLPSSHHGEVLLEDVLKPMPYGQNIFEPIYFSEVTPYPSSRFRLVFCPAVLDTRCHSREIGFLLNQAEDSYL